jgi:hypothetical protein
VNRPDRPSSIWDEYSCGRSGTRSAELDRSMRAFRSIGVPTRGCGGIGPAACQRVATLATVDVLPAGRALASRSRRRLR